MPDGSLTAPHNPPSVMPEKKRARKKQPPAEAGAALVPAKLAPLVLFVRREKVLLDSDLAKLYRVETKRLNEAVKRNIERFPEDFMFQLTADEKSEVVAKCDHLEKLKFSSLQSLVLRPYLFHSAFSILHLQSPHS